ncbi:MAG TPA: SIMPL domain-containing protein [Symbiobacteriaceae bacterium]|nr:SIMPL domain-containing protein [Symbiobacteriaceae bacterium]
MNLMSGLPAGAPVTLNVESLPQLRVTGEGQADAVPDTAVVVLGFSTRAPQAATAFQQTAAVLNRVVAALMEAGIPREQLQTEQISLNPVYERERLVGYEAISTLQVTLRDLSAAGPTIDRAVAAGANNVREVRFELRDPATAEATALALAVQDAQRDAAVLARSLGLRLGPVVRVETEPTPVPVPRLAFQAAAAEAIPVLPGTIRIARTVRVDYAIQ